MSAPNFPGAFGRLETAVEFFLAGEVDREFLAGSLASARELGRPTGPEGGGRMMTFRSTPTGGVGQPPRRSRRIRQGDGCHNDHSNPERAGDCNCGDAYYEALEAAELAEDARKAARDCTTIATAIEAWYSARYPLGLRISGQDRDALAGYIAQRLGLKAAHPERRPGREMGG